MNNIFDYLLLFSSHDAEHNNVVALKAYLEERLDLKKKKTDRS